MPLYMYQASYTSESVANLLEEPRDRIKAVAKAFEGMEAEILVGGYPLGKYDVLVVYTAPDDATAAALALAIAAGGATKSAETTRLLTGEEWITSLRKAQQSRYRPPIRHRLRPRTWRKVRAGDMLRSQRPRISGGWRSCDIALSIVAWPCCTSLGASCLAYRAYNLQHPVYHPAPPPGEMYAVVFVHDPAAHLSLSADIYPNKPWYDSLNVTVGHVLRGQAGWLLVIECPGRASIAHC